MQAEKERKLPPQHPAATDIPGAPSTRVAFSLCFSTGFLLLFFLSELSEGVSKHNVGKRLSELPEVRAKLHFKLIWL